MNEINCNFYNFLKYFVPPVSVSYHCGDALTHKIPCTTIEIVSKYRKREIKVCEKERERKGDKGV